MSFADLGLSDELLRAVGESGYTEPTPIQAQRDPARADEPRSRSASRRRARARPRRSCCRMIDILAHGRARAMMPRSLILEPTRELAAQVAENFEKYGKYHKLSMALLIGGVSMGDQTAALAQKGVDVLIATPGPADGPVRARQDPAVGLQHPRDRRSGSHARHGLHPRYRGDLHEAARHAADFALLRHDAAHHQEAGGSLPFQSQADRGGAPRLLRTC